MRKLIMFFAVIGVMLSLESQAQHAQSQLQHQTSQTKLVADKQLIAKQLQTLWPNTKVGAVSVEGHFAIANWWLEDKAGRALLQFDAASGQWQVILCGGDALVDESFLAQAGVIPAAILASRHKVAEVGLSDAEKTALNSMLKPMKFEHQQIQHRDKSH
jgi:hypothetical protein